MTVTPSAAAFTPLVPPRLGETPVDLRVEAERARTRGYAEGYAAGRAEAVAEAERHRLVEDRAARARAAETAAAMGAAIDGLRAAIAAMDDRAEALVGQSATRIEELALSVAALILDAELSSPARSAAHALRRALDAQPVRTWARVRLSAQDVAVLCADPSAAARLRDVEVAASAEVGPGGAVIELEDGAVDVRIGAALERAVAAHREGAVAGEGERS